MICSALPGDFIVKFIVNVTVSSSLIRKQITARQTVSCLAHSNCVVVTLASKRCFMRFTCVASRRCFGRFGCVALTALLPGGRNTHTHTRLGFLTLLGRHSVHIPPHLVYAHLVTPWLMLRLLKLQTWLMLLHPSQRASEESSAALALHVKHATDYSTQRNCTTK